MTQNSAREMSCWCADPMCSPATLDGPKRPSALLSTVGFGRGDQAEVDANGNFRIVGRVKNIIVPATGHNVAPEPIEQRIVERTPGVEHAVVMGHGKPFLTAVVSGQVGRTEVQEVIDALNAELPSYRRIRAFVLAKESFTLPTTVC